MRNFETERKSKELNKVTNTPDRCSNPARRLHWLRWAGGVFAIFLSQHRAGVAFRERHKGLHRGLRHLQDVGDLLCCPLEFERGTQTKARGNCGRTLSTAALVVTTVLARPGFTALRVIAGSHMVQAIRESFAFWCCTKSALVAIAKALRQG